MALKCSLDALSGKVGYSALVRLLPHLSAWGGPPDVVFGNMAGIWTTVPDEVAVGAARAPEYGTWFVLTPTPDVKR